MGPIKAPVKPTSDFTLDGITLSKEKNNGEVTLQTILGNLELLYIKAKNFHWNVQSHDFYGLHHTFDGVQEVALDWADTIAERARALDIKLDARASRYIKDAWYPEAREGMSDIDMIEDMVLTLKCISTYLNRALREHIFDVVTENKIQDLCADIDKQNYFVKSNIK